MSDGEEWKNSPDDHDAGEEWKPEVKKKNKCRGMYFRLRGEVIEPVTDQADISEAFKMVNRRVALDELGNDSKVSTVFLVIDHNMGCSETPILFETMSWYNGEEYECKRYPTVEAALTGHRESVEALKIAMKNKL
jgi:hypothetical protein